jgi:hypothetical protein
MKERNKILRTANLLDQTGLLVQNEKVGAVVCDWVSWLQRSTSSINPCTRMHDERK